MGENTKIYIDISFISQAKAFEEKNIIHKGAWDAILRLLNENINLTEKYKPDEKFERYHNTILINGERGVGKTSFLLTLKNYLENKNDYRDSLVTLPIIDPTLISTKQHILLLIITAIKDKVNKRFNNFYDENEKLLSQRDNWLYSLQNLAEGLNQVDNIGTNPLNYDVWDDAVLIIEKGLEISKAGLDFERNFHKFVSESLKILEKKAFVLFLDDIDTDFSKGWEVLETLRKYITTPHIITVIAGNFVLYEKLVREKRWELFENLLKFEQEEKSNLKREVDELTQQYLMKILQPRNMINLHKFSYYIFYQDRYKICVKIGD